MAGTIVEGRNVTNDRTLTPDFCIIGSGAGGGVCALKLAEAGFNVLVLEEGPNIPEVAGPAPGQKRKMLNEREVDMYKLLYQEGATRLTKNGGVKVLQGRCLGGGTAVNWSACLPPRKDWPRYHALTRRNCRKSWPKISRISGCKTESIGSMVDTSSASIAMAKSSRLTPR